MQIYIFFPLFQKNVPDKEKIIKFVDAAKLTAVLNLETFYLTKRRRAD